MTIDFRYMKYLENVDNRYKVNKDTPKRIKKELLEINENYKKNYNDNLIKIENKPIILKKKNII